MLRKLPPDVNFETVKILKQLASTNRVLAELRGYADTIPNKHILINVSGLLNFYGGCFHGLFLNYKVWYKNMMPSGKNRGLKNH